MEIIYLQKFQKTNNEEKNIHVETCTNVFHAVNMHTITDRNHFMKRNTEPTNLEFLITPNLTSHRI